MGAQAGKDVLLKIGDGAEPEAFVTVAGLRARTIALNARTVDVTDADSAGRWRELLAGAGVKACSVAGQGVFRDATSDAAVREAFACRESGVSKVILTALCGHGHLDLASYDKYLHGGMQDLDLSDEVLAEAMRHVPEIA